MASGARAQAQHGREPRTVVAQLDDIALRQMRREPVELFIMGPHVDPQLDDENLITAARLRKELLRRAWDHEYFGVSPGLNELFELVDVDAQPRLDLCTIELWYASQATVLVFIPASNGSAAEIGYFSAIADQNAEFGQKSIILLDQAFKNDPGFVALGPARLLKRRGAEVAHVDYSAPDDVWREIEGLISDVQSDSVRRKIFN